VVEDGYGFAGDQLIETLQEVFNLLLCLVEHLEVSQQLHVFLLILIGDFDVFPARL